jgi:hypothetical protein
MTGNSRQVRLHHPKNGPCPGILHQQIFLDRIFRFLALDAIFALIELSELILTHARGLVYKPTSMANVERDTLALIFDRLEDAFSCGSA